MSTGSVSAQGRKRVQQLKLCKNEKTAHEKMVQQENERVQN
jgi:hypothetical protein